MCDRTGGFNAIFLVLVSMLGCMVATPAFADRDIVYSARYYTPPGSHRTSHFHIYRINPDGTGNTQLTFGTHEDMSPLWSPDGRHIAFLRDDVLHVVDSRGRHLKNLHGTATYYVPNDIQWSPDSSSIAYRNVAAASFHVDIVNVKSGKITSYPKTTVYLWSPVRGAIYQKSAEDSDSLSDPIGNGDQSIISVLDESLFAAAWLNDKELMGISEKEPLRRCVFARSDGGEMHHVDLQDPSHDPNATFEPQYLQAIPHDSHSFLLASDRSSSTVRPNRDYDCVDSHDGHLRPFVTNKQFIVFSPDSTRFCTMPGRYTVPYEKPHYFDSRPPGSSYRAVWAAPLQIGWTQTGKTRDITPRLVWVTGADWREKQSRD